MPSDMLRGTVALLAALGACSSAPENIRSRAEEAVRAGSALDGVFKFGSVQLDFSHRQARFAGGPDGLQDCSNATYWCAFGPRDIRFAIPRRCADLERGVWTKEGIETRVANRQEGVVYLTTRNAPNLMLEYRMGQGVSAIFLDPARNELFGETVDDETIALAASSRMYNPATEGRMAICD